MENLRKFEANFTKNCRNFFLLEKVLKFSNVISYCSLVNEISNPSHRNSVSDPLLILLLVICWHLTLFLLHFDLTFQLMTENDSHDRNTESRSSQQSNNLESEKSSSEKKLDGGNSGWWSFLRRRPNVPEAKLPEDKEKTVSTDSTLST